MTTIKHRGSYFAKVLIFSLAFVFYTITNTYAQANSVRTDVTFNWADTQTNLNNPATLESISVGGSVYTTFVVPSNYELTRLGPGGHNGNHIQLNGSQIVGASNATNWNVEALNAYQSLNLNHYFESNSNGDNFCEDYTAVATTDTQIQTISYNPGIPSNPEGILAVTERGGNNCMYIELIGTPVGGGPEQLLGRTFVRNQGNLTGVKAQSPPLPNSDYWSSGRNHVNNQIIGVALYKLSELAPVGSTITSIKYYAASNDNGDGKFFLMQTYAQDDYFDPEFEEVFNGDVGVNDNVPNGSSYTYFANAQPLNGTVVVNTDGTFTYTPNPGFTGTDVFEVQVCLPAPNQSVCDTSVVTLNVKSGVSIDNASSNEGDNLTFTITTNDPSSDPIDFDINYTNNSTINADYSGPSSVTLPANASSVTFNVAAIDDDWLEETQTFNVLISDASNTVTITDGSGLGTIIDTDEATVTTANYDVDEDAGIIQLSVSLTSSSGRVGVEQAFTVDVTVNSSGISFPATDGSDYSATTVTVSFPANSPAGTEFFIPLTILDDNIVEASEQVIQRLSNISFNEIGLAGPGGMVRIHDNDTATVTLEDKTVNENVGTAAYQFTLNGNVQDAFDISFSTTDGSANSLLDFTSNSGNLTFSGTNTEIETASLVIVDDNLIELSEAFTVSGSYSGTAPTITNGQAPNIVFANNPGTVTITDNDAVAGTGIAFDNDNMTVDEAAGTATVNVVLTGNVPGGFTLDFASADDSAIAPGDYVANSGTLTFNGTDGETIPVTFTINDDSLIEPTESFFVNLSNLSTTLISINDNQATINITDNDAVAGTGIAFDNDNITVDEAAGTATVNVVLTGNVPGGFTLDFASADDSAIAPGDYVANSGQLTFNGTDGETIPVTFTINDDSLIEPTESFFVNLSNLSTTLISINDNQATINITDNDAVAGTGIAFDNDNITVDEAAGTATVNVVLTGNVPGGFTLDFASADDSAIAPGDYVANSGTLTFNGTDGETIPVTFTINDDSLIEPTESFFVNLSNLSTTLISINDNQATINITDNDAVAGTGIAFDNDNITVDEAAGTATVNVVLTGNVPGGFTLDFASADDSAIAPGDYVANSGQLTFNGTDGETIPVTFTINDDSLIEPTESFFVNLSNLSTTLISINDNQATINITDNDAVAGTGIAFDNDNITVDEAAGTATVNVVLTGNVPGGFTLDFASADDSAIAPGDYVANSGILTFNGTDGETIPVTFTINDDSLIEPTESFFVNLSNLSTTLISINDNQATINITDNDAVAGTGIAFDNTNVIVTEGTDTFARFTVTLTGTISENVTIDYVTNDGTALDISDITAQSGTITFTPTVSTFDIDVPIIDDTIIEATEEFTVILSNIQSNIGIGFVDGDTTNTATGTINDDDSDPSLGVQFDVTSIDVNEDVGTVSLDVVLNADVQDEFTVEYYTTDGTAVDASDYTGVATGTQTLTFGGANPNTQTITIPIIDDVIIEDIEGFNVILSNISTTLVTILANDTATVNIIDNDGNEGWPEDITIEACDTIPPAADITSTSTCPINVVLVETVDGDTDSCPTEYTITRTWTITDCVGNVREHVQVITIEDTIAPTFVEALPADMTVQCDSVPDAPVITAIDSCEPNMVVNFTETITDSDSCPSDYTITRTWSVPDCAGNAVSHTQVITVEDTVAPTFVEALPESMTVLCNEVPDAVTLTAVDNCDTDVIVDFTETITNDANCMNGYTVTRVWSTSDCAGNTVSHTQIITIEPTGPITASDYDEEMTILCGEEIPAVPELTFMGGCGNYDVVFNEVRQDATDGSEDFMLIRTWNVTDSCGNTASFEQIIFVFQPQLEEVTIDICIEDEAIDLLNYLPESFDANGTFEVLEGNVVLYGSMFDPIDHLPGEYKIAYSSIEGDCKYYVDFTIVVNTDCVPCGRGEIEISEAVTANGDGINDTFEIKGVEFCQFTFGVQIFNRWGDKVYEAKDYRNDWNGSSPSGSVGSSGVLPSGTYYYIISATDNELGITLEPFNGFIYLGTK